MALEGGELLIAELRDRARRWGGRAVDVGFFDATSATIASINEYGAPASNIPPRPFMRLTIKDKKESWGNELASRIKTGDSPKEALSQLGRVMKADILAYISYEWMYARNAKYTIKKKGFDDPLYEQGKVLVPNLRYQVRVSR